MTDLTPEMPDDMTPDAMLAMDFALGTLDRDVRRAVQLRLRSDPAFRTLVETWQATLAPLDELTPAVAPPPVWDAIAAEIAPSRPAGAPVAARPGLWNSLALWRSLAVAGTAAAAIALVQPGPTPVALPPLLVAALAGTDGAPLLAAAYDPVRGAIILTPATRRDDGAKSPELWVIEGDEPPRSLGVIDISGPNAHVIPAQRLAGLKPGSTLAISIEPRGGSPTGLPTGPVVASGKLSAV